jgi:hypothetical protein
VRGQETPTQLGPLERATGQWTKSKNPIVLNVIYHRQNPLKFILTLLRVDHSVFLDPSAPDGRTRRHELFVGTSKQDMLKYFGCLEREGIGEGR